MMDKQKHGGLAVMIGLRPPKGKPMAESSEDNDRPADKEFGQALLDAIKADDAAGVADAIKGLCYRVAAEDPESDESE